MAAKNKEISKNWTLKVLSDRKYEILIIENKNEGVFINNIFNDIDISDFDTYNYAEKIIGPDTVNNIHKSKLNLKRKLSEVLLLETKICSETETRGKCFEVVKKISEEKDKPKSNNIKHCSDIDLVNELKRRLQN